MTRLALTALLLVAPLATPLAADPPARQATTPAPPAPVPPAPIPSPDPEPAAALRIVGETQIAPYRVVRLKAVGVPAKAGVIWKVRPLAADAPANAVDWVGRQNVREPEWVAPPGQYRVELSVGSMGADGTMALDYTEVIVTIGQAPQPPPVPPVPPGPVPPGPTPGPAPIPGDGLRALFVFESGKLQTYPPGQLAALYSKTVRDYLNARCPKGPDGVTPERRWYDADQDVSAESKTWQDAMKRPRASLPWVIISNGKAGFEGPLPNSIEELLALLKQYGG